MSILEGVELSLQRAQQAHQTLHSPAKSNFVGQIVNKLDRLPLLLNWLLLSIHW